MDDSVSISALNQSVYIHMHIHLRTHVHMQVHVQWFVCAVVARTALYGLIRCEFGVVRSCMVLSGLAPRED